MDICGRDIFCVYLVQEERKMMRQLDEALERRADRGRSFLLGGRGTRVAATPPPQATQSVLYMYEPVHPL